MIPNRSPVATSLCPKGGIRVVCETGAGQAGDPIEVHAGDDLIGSAPLRPARRDGALVARIGLRDVPRLEYPARLRVMNARSLAELGHGLKLADAASLIAAAGAPVVSAAFAGQQSDGLVFTVTPDRLARHARPFTLHRDDGATETALSSPDPQGGPAQRVVFAGPVPLTPGTSFRLTEATFGTLVLAGTFDTATMLAGALAQLARLEREVASLAAGNLALRRRLDTAIDLGRDRMLLERLDLFYLLLCERDRDAAPTARRPPDEMPNVRRFGPAEVDGIGIFDVETEGNRQWRWFGPDATIALRDLVGPLRRVVLYFHGFGDAPEPPGVRVSTGGAGEPALLRRLEPGYALDIPVSRASALLQGMLVIHISFDRHQTSHADPRRLSAVFSGAEVISASS